MKEEEEAQMEWRDVTRRHGSFLETCGNGLGGGGIELETHSVR